MLAATITSELALLTQLTAKITSELALLTR